MILASLTEMFWQETASAPGTTTCSAVARFSFPSQRYFDSIIQLRNFCPEGSYGGSFRMCAALSSPTTCTLTGIDASTTSLSM